MIEINENIEINDNIINDQKDNNKSFKTFNTLKEIQTLLKKEANLKDICKIINYNIIKFSY